MRAVLAAVAAAGGIVVSAQSAARPQQAQPTFRSAINYVEVDVVVTDADGRFVPGLTAADFEIRDAGTPQTIEAFHEINVPIERADRPVIAGPVVPADVASNERLSEGRLFVLFLDDAHTTPARTNDVRRRAREFIEQYLGSNDIAAVVHASGRRGATQDFTSNRELLMVSIDRFSGTGLRPSVIARMEDMQMRMGTQQESAPTRDREARERAGRARGTFEALGQLATHLAPITGRRKALLWFSEGIDIEGAPEASQQYAADAIETRRAMIDAVAAATRANVHVYAIDAGGLTNSFFGAGVAAIPTGERAEREGLTVEALADERRRSLNTLRAISEQTGGAAVVDSNNIASGFARIQRENSAYYVLGFYARTAPDGKFHPLDVTVKRPGLQVRSRPGYHAAKPEDAKPTKGSDVPLNDLMRAPLPAGNLPLRVSLPVFKQSRSEASVLIAVDLPRDIFLFEPAGDLFAEDVHLVYQVIGGDTKVVVSEAHDLEMRLPAEVRDRVATRGFRVVFPVTVKPGRYQLRVAASLKNATRRGSVFADLVVPDFFDDPLVWSGVVLSSASAAAVPTRPAGNARDLVPLMPAATRTFPVDDTLALYAEAYDNNTRGTHVVDLTASIRDATGKVVFTSTEQRSSAELRGGRGGYGLRVDMPLDGLPPGQYVLTLTAKSRAGADAAATREIAFAIS